jgi:hypothetical protein
MTTQVRPAARNEQTASWDRVAIEDDDRALTLTKIHSPPWAGGGRTWWATAGTTVETSPEAVSVRVLLEERAEKGPDAMRFDDPARAVRVVLDEPLRGRPVIDGSAHLIAPEPDPSHPPELVPFDRIQRADDRTLVVYWYGGPYFPLDHVSTDWRLGALVLGVWIYGGGGPASGQYQAAIVRVPRPLGRRRRIRDLARTLRVRLRRGSD